MSFLCLENDALVGTSIDKHMTSEQLEHRLLERFRYEPTEGQKRLFHAFARFVVSDKERCALLLKGYAGTGKTTSISLLVEVSEQLGIPYVLLAPTGRAARVLLISHVYSGFGCKLMLIGDTAQLPPVGSGYSPALHLEHLKNSYYLNIAEVELSEVIRQKEGSGILENATHLRKLIHDKTEGLPTLTAGHLPDVERIDRDLQDYLENAYSRYGKDDMIIVTRSNKRANLFNQQIRQRILWLEEEISAGDRMMVLKNNYYWLKPAEHTAGFVANGDTIEIKRVLKFEDRGAFRFCKAIIKMPDYPDMPEFESILLCNTIWDTHASMPQEQRMELARMIAEDFPDITDTRQLKKAVRSDPYYNALQVKFSYAITCHKAQGGQWPCVFVDQGYVTDEMAGVELNRWFYTAFTRAQEKLYFVGFEEQFFG